MNSARGEASLQVPNWQYFHGLTNRLHLTTDDTRTGPSLPVALRRHERQQYSLYTDLRAPTGQPHDAEGFAKLHLSFRFGRICLLVNSIQVWGDDDRLRITRPGMLRGLHQSSQPAQLCAPDGRVGAYCATVSLTERCGLYPTDPAGLARGDRIGSELDARNFIEGGLGRVALGIAQDPVAPVLPIRPGG